MNFVAYWIPAFAGMTSGRKGICRSLLLCAFFLLQLPSSAEGGAGAGELDGPAGTVAQFHDKLLDVMQRAGELGYQGRYRELEPYINDHFDIPFITQVILGRHRKQLSETQQEEFIDVFGRSSIATYASRFNGYDGEEFQELAREALRRGRVLIRTELRRAHDEPVALDYLLHEKQGKWYIVSVSANGVNDLSLKRAEYAAVIKEKGYNGLVMEILSKIENMENKE